MKRALPLLSLLFLVASAGCESPASITYPSAPPAANGRLLWADEFDGAAGTLPLSSHWAFDVGTDWGNGQLEYDTARPSNVSLDGAGHLAITARREDYQGCASYFP